jgi:penicillin-binding protein 2
LAAHTLGYVGEISEEELADKKGAGYRVGSTVGKMGLEQYCDDILRGQDGGTRVEVDVAGRIVQEIGKREPVPGHSIYLTIDFDIQQATEKALDEHLTWLRQHGGSPNAFAAAVVAIDPRDGAVLAMASRPAFDPNLFVSGITQKDWNALSQNIYNPLNNRVISGQYPPGSTFKVVTSAAALETGKVRPQERIFDAGYHWAMPQKGNHESTALGWIDYYEAMTKSDNVYFYEMGYRVGIDNLEKYAEGFGYGKPTGIGLFGEAEGMVAGRVTKKKLTAEEWLLAETFDAAIGQGYQLATPLQMVSAIAALGNSGNRYQPYLVSRVVSDRGELLTRITPKEAGKLPISEQTSHVIRQALHGVTQPGGTAWPLSYLPVLLAGKTGTAENSHGRDHGVFVAYGPIGSPQIAIAVVVEQGGYGAVAALPIAQNILTEYFNVGNNKTGKKK